LIRYSSIGDCIITVIVLDSYMGHGGGEKYIKGDRVRSLQTCAPCLLIGCSSGFLHNWGDYETTGTLLNYMIAECPALMVNLWDVTDRDIDRFSKSVFHRWGLIPNQDSTSPHSTTTMTSVTLCDAVAQSRSQCILKYLVGAAPIVYGLPIQLVYT
jgi:separase